MEHRFDNARQWAKRFDDPRGRPILGAAAAFQAASRLEAGWAGLPCPPISPAASSRERAVQKRLDKVVAVQAADTPSLPEAGREAYFRKLAESGLERVPHACFLRIHTEDQNRCCQRRPQYGPAAFNAVHHGHREVHDDDPRRQLPGQFHTSAPLLASPMTVELGSSSTDRCKHFRRNAWSIDEQH